jgi:hypothetical protein
VESRHLNPRCVIFDICKALLDVSPPPGDAEARWAGLLNKTFDGQPRLGITELAGTTNRIIAREHSIARAAGVWHPEIYWPHLMTGALPELSQLDGSPPREPAWRRILRRPGCGFNGRRLLFLKKGGTRAPVGPRP